jgi:CRP-like cAMP-binding protein
MLPAAKRLVTRKGKLMSIDINTTTAPEQPQQSLSTAAARNLATTTKTVPQMQGITSRWLLRMLPWVQVSGGTYRVNRRLTYAVGGGLVSFAQTGSNVSVIPPSLREVPALANVDDDALLASLAARFIRQEVSAGATVAQRGHAADQFYLVVHGKLNRHGAGAFDGGTVLGVLADGSYFGTDVLTAADATWDYTAVATTACTLLRLSRQEFEAALSQSHALRTHLRAFTAATQRPQNRRGESDIAVAAGHAGEVSLPATFADYEQAPREYELSAAQTVLRVHSRVADLFNEPMNQVEQQLRLTIEALRERQEHEMINNPEFGLLHNVAYDQRVHPHAGPPTPDDLDELLSRRRSTRLLLAHPRTIAAFGRECSKRGIYPGHVEVLESRLPAWRGVPIFPCGNIPVTAERTSTILAMRTGEEDQGVVGLHQTGIPDEYQPSLNVRFMGVDDKAVISYLVSAYYSVAVLVPDALGALMNVEISRPFS